MSKKLFLISWVDASNGATCFWSSKQKAWISDRDEATRYTEKQAKQLEAMGKRPERGEWLEIELTPADFERKYTDALFEAGRLKPHEYPYKTIAEAREASQKIIADLRDGKASRLGDVVKRIACKFDLKADVDAIQSFLNSGA